MIKVLVSGPRGRMGSQVVAAVDAANDMDLVAGFDPAATQGDVIGSAEVMLFDDLAQAIEQTSPDVMVDFTRPDVVEANLICALGHGVDCVVGTTGLSEDDLARIAKEGTEGTTLFYAPNFTTGAVLMMRFAREAARFFPDIEIIEMHHDGKKDAPSGTAVTTAHMIAEAKEQESHAPGRETELPGMEGARGALVEGIPVHSVRAAGYVAHQEVILASAGQTLTIRHDSIDRSSYMPGVLLAVRAVGNMSGLHIGLEKLMF